MESTTNPASLSYSAEATLTEAPVVQATAVLDPALHLEACAEALEQSLKRSAQCPAGFPDACPDAPADAMVREISADSIGFKAELQIFLSTFFTIFLAEVGDKTQLTVLFMSAESQSPWVVFLGAGAALISTSLCGVLLGRWLSTQLSPKTLETSAGLLLLGISLMLGWEFFNSLA